MDSGISAIIAAAITLAATIFRDFVNGRSKLALEKLKIHDKERIEAFKRLFIFARKIKNSTFPLAEHKTNDFRNIMQNSYKNKLEFDYPYFNSDIRGILDAFEEEFVCMTSPELIPETVDKTNEFIEKDAFPLASKLEKFSKDQMEVKI